MQPFSRSAPACCLPRVSPSILLTFEIVTANIEKANVRRVTPFYLNYLSSLQN